VDLNLNYPAGFENAKENKYKKEVYKPGPRDYVGPNALSEIESRNLYNFTKLHEFDISISLHSQGEEIYWSYQDIKLPEAYELGKKFSKVSGYKLTEPKYNSSFAGYKDWFIKEFKKPGFTIEIGKGIEGLPLPLKDIDNIYQKVEEIFFISAI